MPRPPTCVDFHCLCSSFTMISIRWSIPDYIGLKLVQAQQVFEKDD